LEEIPQGMYMLLLYGVERTEVLRIYKE
jgi:hypothetical protein